MARSKGSANLAASLEVLAGAPLDARLVVDNLTDLITASTFPYSYVGMPVAVKSEEKLFMLTATPTTNINNWKEIGETCKPEIQWGYLYNNKMYEESSHTTEITAETDTLYITKDTDKFYKFDGTDYVQIGGGVDAVVYQPGGSYLFANIPALSAATLGFVYDVQDAFTTTSDFLEGAGIDYPAGTNIVVVNTGTSQSPTYKYDVLIGELSGYQKKVQYTALPTANADELGNIYQYVGTTTSSLTNGCWYKCVSDGESTPTYSWEMVATQEVDRVIAKADFDLLPAAQKNNGLTYYIPDASAVSNLTVMGNRFDKANIYTADERMVGSWMGKPLYQKTIDFGALPNNTAKQVSHGISDIDKIIKISTVISTNDGTTQMVDSAVITISNTIDNGVTFFADKTNLYAKSSMDISSMSGYCTLQYTKTSDGTISIGTENDYSTDEMIIGTWIDSKPLYQKVLHPADITNDAGTSFTPIGVSFDWIEVVGGYMTDKFGQKVPLCYYANGSTYYDIRQEGGIWGIKNVAMSTNHYTDIYVIVQYTKTTD